MKLVGVSSRDFCNSRKYLYLKAGGGAVALSWQAEELVAARAMPPS